MENNMQELTPDEAAASLSLASRLAEKVLLKPGDGEKEQPPEEVAPQSSVATAEPTPQVDQEEHTKEIVAEEVKSFGKELKQNIEKELSKIRKKIEGIINKE